MVKMGWNDLLVMSIGPNPGGKDYFYGTRRQRRTHAVTFNA